MILSGSCGRILPGSYQDPARILAGIFYQGKDDISELNLCMAVVFLHVLCMKMMPFVSKSDS